jgi:GntR family transcriptional regulator
MIVLDYRDKRPLYEQVVEKLEHLIICGALKAGDKMPSVRSLALDLSVNPNTIQRAYAQLEQDGYIYTIVGRGNYVSEESAWKGGKLDDIEIQLKKLLTQAAAAGMSKERIVHTLDEIYKKALEPDAHSNGSELNKDGR